MKTLKSLIKIIFPNLYFSWLVSHYKNNYLKIRDPIKFTKDKYQKMFGIPLDLDKPTSFYEKINFLKLFHLENKPELLVDKDLVKQYLFELNLDKYIIAKIDSFDSFGSFKEFISKKSYLYHSFVVKLNHTSGDVFFYINGVWKDKHGERVSKRFVYACLSKKIKLNYYYVNLEKVYQNVKPRILVEEYVPSMDNGGLDEYKFFCNYGDIKLINVVYGRQKGQKVKEAFTNPDLSIINASQNQPIIDCVYRPNCFDEMIEFCKLTSKGRAMIRVDLLTDGKVFYFCEFTFYDCAGYNIFYPLEQNNYIGDKFDLKEALYERI